MANIRPINKEKYNISKHRFLELYYFCLQYNEWREELRLNTDTVRSIPLDGLPRGKDVSDPTAALVCKRMELERKCKLVEQTALEADGDLYQYILKAVTNESITYNYLRMVKNIPCGKNTFYDRRRRFYSLLSNKI